MKRAIPALMVASGAKPVSVGIAQKQHKSYFSSANATTHNIVLDSTPIQGNLMILCVVSDDAVTSTPAGWTAVNNASGFCDIFMYWKIAGASESSTISVTINSSDCCILFAYEYSGLTTLDKTNAATGQGGSNTINTGTTATTTAANELVIALVGSASNATGRSISSWSNSLVADFSGLTSVTVVLGGVAILVVSATGTYTTTATMNISGSGNDVGIIATFK